MIEEIGDKGLPRDGDVFGIEPSEVSGSLTVWEDTIGLVLVVTESRRHERLKNIFVDIFWEKIGKIKYIKFLIF